MRRQRHDRTLPAALGQVHVSAETACEITHKTLQRKCRDRGDQNYDDLGRRRGAKDVLELLTGHAACAWRQ
jgi:hypothetical protein